MPKPDPIENETDRKREEEDGQRKSKRENFNLRNKIVTEWFLICPLKTHHPLIYTRATFSRANPVS